MWQGMETPMIHLTYGLVFDFKGFKRPVRNVFLATRRKRMVHIRVFPPSIIVNHQCLWWKGPALRGKNPPVFPNLVAFFAPVLFLRSTEVQTWGPWMNTKHALIGMVVRPPLAPTPSIFSGN